MCQIIDWPFCEAVFQKTGSLFVSLITNNSIMDITPFNLYYEQDGTLVSAEILPCCREDNVVDYAVWIDGKLAFTIAKSIKNTDDWVVALKNADDDIDDALVQSIGASIEKKTDP
jgi:hypothetical protein